MKKCCRGLGITVAIYMSRTRSPLTMCGLAETGLNIGTARHEVWGTGEGIWHYDGSAWSLAKDTHAEQMAIVGPNDIWAWTGTEFLHYDGSTWTAFSTDTSPEQSSFAGFAVYASDDIYAAGRG